MMGADGSAGEPGGGPVVLGVPAEGVAVGHLSELPDAVPGDQGLGPAGVELLWRAGRGHRASIMSVTDE